MCVTRLLVGPPFSKICVFYYINYNVTLKLCLDHYHLEQGGKKAAVVDLGHTQQLSGNHTHSGQTSESDDSTNDDSNASSSSSSDEGDAGDNSDGAEEGPFTKAQQSALVKRVTHKLKKANKPQSSTVNSKKHSHHHTLSPPSDEPGHRQRSTHLSNSCTHSSRHRKRKRRHIYIMSRLGRDLWSNAEL